ncbi:hypothetical protein [Nonomuraea jabiensis]|uniref:hypothetical protein n=1 Tax=Nonomuraea jabiensis TaxID=882448 RepID=UPI00368101C5
MRRGTSKQFTIISQVTPAPSATLPLTISYRWSWADGSYTAPFTHTFTQAAALRPQRVWDEWISKTGKIWLEVAAKNPNFLPIQLTLRVRRSTFDGVTTTALTIRGHVDFCRVASALCPSFRPQANPLTEGKIPCHPCPSSLSPAG